VAGTAWRWRSNGASRLQRIAAGAPRPREGAERGFTLVEILVVVAVLGLLTAVIVLNLPESGGRLADEADALAARLTRAQEEAILTNRTVEVAVGSGGYAFRVQRAGGWAPLEDGPFEPRRWGDGISVAVRAAEGRSGVRFDPTGAAEPVEITLHKKAQSVRVRVDGQGGVSVAPGA
jgi:general secretion pathway protein H